MNRKKQQLIESAIRKIVNRVRKQLVEVDIRDPDVKEKNPEICS